MLDFLTVAGKIFVLASAVLSQSIAPQGENFSCAAQSMSEAANIARTSLSEKDGLALAKLVHPEDGVRISPSAFVDVELDRVLSRTEAARFWVDPADYLWGYAEGRGEPIELSGMEYALHFFAGIEDMQPTASWLQSQTLGNTVSNSGKVYPNAFVADYGVNVENPQDQSGVRMVIQPIDDCWFLVGIISIHWSP